MPFACRPPSRANVLNTYEGVEAGFQDRNDCSCFCVVSVENQPRTSSSFLGVDRTWLPLPAAAPTTATR